MALEDTAQKLIAKFGRSATLVSRGTSPGNANAPWDANESEATTQISMVFVNEQQQQDGSTNVGTATKTALIAGLDASLVTEGDRVIDGSVTWQVLGADPVKPGSTLYIWKVRLGR